MTGDPRDFFVSRSAPRIRDGEVLVMREPGLQSMIYSAERKVGTFNATLLQSWQSGTEEAAKIR